MAKLSDQFGRKHLLMGALFLYALGKAVCGIRREHGDADHRALHLRPWRRRTFGAGHGHHLRRGAAAEAGRVHGRHRLRVRAGHRRWGRCWAAGSCRCPGWRWLFCVHRPAGRSSPFAAVMGFFLAETGAPRAPAALPSTVGGMAALAHGRGPRSCWPPPGAACCTPWDPARRSSGCMGRAAASVAAFVFVQVERRAKEPVIPLSLFRNRNFVLCCRHRPA